MSKSKWKEYAKDLEKELEEASIANKILEEKLSESNYFIDYLKTLVNEYTLRR